MTVQVFVFQILKMFSSSWFTLAVLTNEQLLIKVPQFISGRDYSTILIPEFQSRSHSIVSLHLILFLRHPSSNGYLFKRKKSSEESMHSLCKKKYMYILLKCWLLQQCMRLNCRIWAFISYLWFLSVFNDTLYVFILSLI